MQNIIFDVFGLLAIFFMMIVFGLFVHFIIKDDKFKNEEEKENE